MELHRGIAMQDATQVKLFNHATMMSQSLLMIEIK
jgi:hypothetical protein